MSINRSSRYEEIHDKTHEQFFTQPQNPTEAHWWKKYAPMWRNRVGLARLTADAASGEAAGLLRSINPGLFRTDPETLQLLREAQEAATAFSAAMERESWRRFKGETDA
ncbi:hypothetical protein [Microbacterium sp. H6]|uniref:hypothetical protein n=1 Tax=Microbacterium sp. H6 TaxID=421122 RepID=UPI000DE4BBCC|nr:hypothetical protein [Microbacterium sp. H6]RBO72831.1 hypothetical protein DSP71_08885 [Microbacterium sp. H6]